MTTNEQISHSANRLARINRLTRDDLDDLVQDGWLAVAGGHDPAAAMSRSASAMRRRIARTTQLTIDVGGDDLGLHVSDLLTLIPVVADREFALAVAGGQIENRGNDNRRFHKIIENARTN